MKDEQNKLIALERSSAWEKLTRYVKGAIFGILFVLLEDIPANLWWFLVCLLVEFHQMLLFPFSPITNFEWKNGSFTEVVQSYLKIFWLYPYLEKTNSTIYIITFYACVVLLLIIIIDIIYVSYSFQK